MLNDRVAAFPAPYPDELFYSVCARFAKLMAYGSRRAVTTQLFGTPNALAIIDLPAYLENFVARLAVGHSYTVDRLIDQHTLLPYYAPFLPPERVALVRNDMRQDRGGSIHMRIGIMPSRVPQPAYLRICPLCVEEDRKLYCECYWHRVHQLPGVLVCPKHSCALEDTSALTHNARMRHEFVCAEDAINAGKFRCLEIPGDLEVAYALACDAFWLLQQHGLSQDQASSRHRYSHLLAERGLATYTGQVRVRKLVASFEMYYSDELLRLLGCGLAVNESNSFLPKLFRAKAAQHPLYHLLLIHYLGHTAESFFGLSNDWSPFGCGPWPCLNPVCDNYRLPKLTQHSVHYSAGKPVGVFACSACGYVYSRTGPDSNPSDKYRASRVESYGSLWHRRLEKLWLDPMISLREIGRHLGADPATVRAHAATLGLPLRSATAKVALGPQPCNSERDRTNDIEILLSKKRALWLTAVQKNPTLGVKALRSVLPAVYAWLYRHDRGWLTANTPARSATERVSKRVDWELRDMQLAEAVRAAHLRLLDTKRRPVLASRTAIARETGFPAVIAQHLAQLPKTGELLEELSETREAYAIRRIHWVTEIFRKQSVPVPGWKIIREAGVARLAAHPMVLIAIDEAVKELSAAQATKPPQLDAVEP